MGQKKINFDLVKQCMELEKQGVPTKEICEKIGVKERTFYLWKEKYATMSSRMFELCKNQKLTIVELTEKIKSLEKTNKQLENDNTMLAVKASLFKQIWDNESHISTDHKRGLVDYLFNHYGISLSLALKIVGLSKSVYDYEKMEKNDGAIYQRLEELARAHPGGSCRSYIKIMKDEGRGWNHKRIRRIYNALQLLNR